MIDWVGWVALRVMGAGTGSGSKLGAAPETGGNCDPSALPPVV